MNRRNMEPIFLGPEAVPVEENALQSATKINHFEFGAERLATTQLSVGFGLLQTYYNWQGPNE